MALPKRHWGNAAQSPGFVPDAACGRSGVREIITTSALAFDVSVSRNTDWYCADCATAARLALALFAAPKPDAVVWPKPRPIAEAPKLECILAYVPESSDPHLKGRWLLMAATEDKEKIDGFTVLGANPAADRWFPCSILQPTHFLPLPPEVK